MNVEGGCLGGAKVGPKSSDIRVEFEKRARYVQSVVGLACAPGGMRLAT